jgi:hypothetical protein
VYISPMSNASAAVNATSGPRLTNGRAYGLAS